MDMVEGLKAAGDLSVTALLVVVLWQGLKRFDCISSSPWRREVSCLRMKSSRSVRKCSVAMVSRSKNYPHKDGGMYLKVLLIEGLFYFTCFHSLSVLVNHLHCMARWGRAGVLWAL